MKRLVLTVLALAAFVGIASATELRLENDTDVLAFYTVAAFTSLPSDPVSQAETLVSKFLGDLPTAAYLPAGTVRTHFVIPETPAKLVVMFLNAGTWQFGALDLPKISTVNLGTYVSFSKATMLKNADGQILGAGPLEINVPKQLIRIDGRFVDWLTVPDALVAAQGQPLAISREANGKRATITLGQAFTKNKGGTDLERLKLVADNSNLYLMVSSYSAMGKGLSILLRLYRDGSDVNPWTLEIPIHAAGGQVFLWTASPANRQVLNDCGDFNQIGLFLEARIRLDALPRDLLQSLSRDGTRLEASLSFTDGSITEEWYYGSVDTRTIGGLSGS